MKISQNLEKIRETSFHKNFLENLEFSLKFTFSTHFHVLAVLSRLRIRPTCPVRRVSAVLSQIFCPRGSFMNRLSCPSCPIPAVLFQLPCPGRLVHCFPDATVMSWQSCHLCPFQAQVSRLTCQPTCPDCPDPGFPVPAVPSRRPLSTATVVSSRLSCLY